MSIIRTFIDWYLWGFHFIQTLIFSPTMTLAIVWYHSLCLLLQGTSNGLVKDMVSDVEVPVALLCGTIYVGKFCVSPIFRKGLTWPTSQLESLPIRRYVKCSSTKGSTRLLKNEVPAYIYWEDALPLCTDVHKKKYGGPISIEEVKDIKSVWFVDLVFKWIMMISPQWCTL